MNLIDSSFIVHHSSFYFRDLVHVCRSVPGTRPAPPRRRSAGTLPLGPDGRRLRHDRRRRLAARRLGASPPRRPQRRPRALARLRQRLPRTRRRRLPRRPAAPALRDLRVLLRQQLLPLAQRRRRRGRLEAGRADFRERLSLHRRLPVHRRGADAVRAEPAGPALAPHLRPGRPQLQGSAAAPRPVGLLRPLARLPVRQLVHLRPGQARGPTPHLRPTRLLGHDAAVAVHQRPAGRLQHPGRHPPADHPHRPHQAGPALRGLSRPRPRLRRPDVAGAAGSQRRQPPLRPARRRSRLGRREPQGPFAPVRHAQLREHRRCVQGRQRRRGVGLPQLRHRSDRRRTAADGRLPLRRPAVVAGGPLGGSRLGGGPRSGWPAPGRGGIRCPTAAEHPAVRGDAAEGAADRGGVEAVGCRCRGAGGEAARDRRATEGREGRAAGPGEGTRGGGRPTRPGQQTGRPRHDPLRVQFRHLPGL